MNAREFIETWRDECKGDPAATVLTILAMPLLVLGAALLFILDATDIPNTEATDDHD